jgi:putative spermidine/putrescine transport system permease protein
MGAGAATTFRRVVWPLALPGVVAGSIFSFSLTLGDYIAPDLIGNTQFIGNVVYDKVGLGDIPFAAAYCMVPVAIMAAYLFMARRLGAFEAL